MNYFSIKDSTSYYETFPFSKFGSPLSDAPLCAITLKKAGNMRFRWNETNAHRDKILNQIKNEWDKTSLTQIASVELSHSKTVYKITSKDELDNLQGDGIITNNPKIMPVVTVADCLCIYLYDQKTKAFGVVHSGWKGTGICATAIQMMKTEYASKSEDIFVVIGPHIKNCCYIVDENRASYFRDNFCTDCVSPLESGGKCYCGGRGLKIDWDNGDGPLYRLSLEKANLALLEKEEIPSSNISICQDCTCCNQVFGSNRRETSESNTFTVQAAFILPQTHL